MKITIEICDDIARVLEALDEKGSAERTLNQLVYRCFEGVTRPGSWEREWLFQGFGDEWLERLEPDPDLEWCERPRARHHGSRKPTV